MNRVGVRVVIVNYRTGTLVTECLRSLAAEASDLSRLRVVVVDNASGDDSLQVINEAVEREGWSRWVEVLPLEANDGFAAGNNAGIRAAMAEGIPPDYFLLLNPDTLARPGAVRELVEFMERTPRAGIAGSLIADERGDVQRAAHRAPSPVGELVQSARFAPMTRLLKRFDVSPPAPQGEQQCDWVSGAAMMIRREALSKVGLLDEAFFLYFEEVDLCCRVRSAGWEVWYVPASQIVHLEGSATGITEAKRRRTRYWYESRRRFYVKHYGVAGLLAADAMWAAGRSMLMARRALRLGGNTAGDPKRFALDLLGGDMTACVKGHLRGRAPNSNVE